MMAEDHYQTQNYDDATNDKQNPAQSFHINTEIDCNGKGWAAQCAAQP